MRHFADPRRPNGLRPGERIEARLRVPGTDDVVLEDPNGAPTLENGWRGTCFAALGSATRRPVADL
jgi:hypothetical protein